MGFHLQIRLEAAKPHGDSLLTPGHSTEAAGRPELDEP